MREIPLADNAEAFAFARQLFAGGFEMVILLTGVGTRQLNRLLATRFPEAAFAEALRRVTLVARGPKPVAALRDMGLQPAIVAPEPNTWRELLAATEGRPERRIAVQEYGRSNPELLDALRARGGEVTPVRVYQWDLPEDVEPLREAVRRLAAGAFDVALFTPAPPPRGKAAPPAPAGGGPAPAVAAPAGRDVIEELRRIAAERTGYPPEMLDLDAGIESDLGIDSIKRVEILTALQKLGTPEQQQQVQGVLNKLTSARTLREIASILEQTVGQVPGPSAPVPSAPPAAAASASRDFITELRAVAADRTGYPPEMLDLDAGIEADLGIDSIKLVEILTALQKLGTPEQQQHVQGIMNKLTSARTLREIADLIASSVGATAAAPAPPAPAPATPAAPAVSAGRDYLAELVKIASERTGYEPDMLDLDAGIEADLGIDSIKRVEILTALQQRSTPAEQAQIQGAMEKLTSARTLREIADCIAAAVGQPEQQPASAAQVPRFILTTADKPRDRKSKRRVGKECRSRWSTSPFR